MLAPVSIAANPDVVISEMLQAASARSDIRIENGKQQLERQDKPATVDAASARRLNTEAIATSKGGDVESAIRLFKEAHLADPGSPSIAANLSLAYIKAGNFGESAAATKRALALAPSNSQLWFNLGQALGGAGLTPQGAASFYLAMHFAAVPEKITEALTRLSNANNAGMAASARMALANMAAKTPEAEKMVSQPSVPAKQAAPSISAAADIAGIASLVLNESSVSDLTKPGYDKDSRYKYGLESFMAGYKSGNNQPEHAVQALRDAAYLGHPDAPGLLGVFIVSGYKQINGQRTAPDLAEARKLFELSNARGGSMGYLGQGDLALEGDGEPRNVLKGIGLYEKAAIKKNPVAERRLVLSKVHFKDPAVVAATNAAIQRAGIDPNKVRSITAAATAPEPKTDPLICTIIDDQIETAKRSGDRMGVTNANFKKSQLNC